MYNFLKAQFFFYILYFVMVCYVNDWFNPSPKKKEKRERERKKIGLIFLKRRKKKQKMYNFFLHIINFPKLIFREK